MKSKADEVIAMTVKGGQQEPDSGISTAKPPTPVIEGIQSRKDGTYVVTLDGYPYHATLNETPNVFKMVLELIEAGAEVIEHVEPELYKPAPEQAAIEEYDRLRGVADFTIAPLQDAVDLDEATAQEVASLKLWKQYRVLLSRVSTQPDYPKTINWPVAPV